MRSLRLGMNGDNTLNVMTSSVGDQRPSALSVSDIIWASITGIVALVLFVATLQPDFGGPEDTPADSNWVTERILGISFVGLHYTTAIGRSP